jgi:hypothetical protein
MFAFVRSFDDSAVIVRVQSDVLIEGLRRIDPASVLQVRPGDAAPIGRSDWLVVHYSDRSALDAARRAKQATGCRIACLGADIYRIGLYVTLDEHVDHFLMPTPLHCEIVRAAVWHPCDHLPEGIDRIAVPNGGVPEPVSADVSLGWFGYPESFKKALLYVLPRALAEAGIAPAQLTMITSADQELVPGARHLTFSERDFYMQSAGLSHVLLSHFAFDGHINSYIKSPNKLITSLVRGLTPVFSATPAYLELARDYELEELVFRNGPELTDRLRRLTELRLGESRLAAIAADLRERLAPERIARRFLDIIG